MISFPKLLEAQTAQLQKVEQDFKTANFADPAVAFMFVATNLSLFVHARVYGLVYENKDIQSDAEMKSMIELLPMFQSHLYVPKREEIETHLNAVNKYIALAKQLDYKFWALVKIDDASIGSIAQAGLNIVNSTNPPIVPMHDVKQQTQKPAKKRDDEGVSFMKTGFLSPKKK